MSEVPAELARLRGSIDNMDAALIHLLAERFKITQRVGELKATQGLPAADPGREAQQIARLRELGVVVCDSNAQAARVAAAIIQEG